MDKICIRAFTPEIMKVDEEKRTITFVASDGTRDSAHTVLNQEGWDLARFNANPVIGYNHEVYGAWDTKDVDFGLGLGGTYNLTENAFVQARYTMGMTKVFDGDYNKEKNGNIQIAFGMKF